MNILKRKKKVMNDKEYFMKEALKEAKNAYKKLEVPVGVVIVKDNEIIARGYNQKEMKNNPIKHAEIIAIKKACRKLKNWHLDECTLYTTLEPCIMCIGAITQARIKKIIYISENSKFGFTNYFKNNKITNHKLIIEKYPNNKEYEEILINFFRSKR